jgi:hypothetical protein
MTGWCFLLGLGMSYKALLNAVDAANTEAAESGFRHHLGASLIGRECERDIWYSFRWAQRATFPPRILRLFERGHLEEFRFVKNLRAAGVIVQEYSQRLVYDPVTSLYDALDWDDIAGDDPALSDVTGDVLHHRAAAKQLVECKQWRVKGIKGHFGGSLDGIAYNLPEYNPHDKFLLEFKTHNTKSFIHLDSNGVKIAKPEHYSQMQIYMHLKDLPAAVYCAVNKNDDAFHFEAVERVDSVAEKLLAKAERIIFSPKPPTRLSNSPAWFACKFCNHNKICHFAEPMAKNCRTCEYSEPVEDGQWSCKKWNNIIPVDFLEKGCDSHQSITD